MRRRVLLDENLSPRLHRLSDDELELVSVAYRGWAGRTNGELLRLAAREFDVLLTLDTNLSYQNPIPQLDIAIVLVTAASTRFEDLQRSPEGIRTALQDARSGTLTRVTTDLPPAHPTS